MYSGVSKLRSMGISLLVAISVISSAGAALAATPYTDAANKALGWMKTQQQPDASFAGFGAGSTIDAVFAMIAAKQDPSNYTSQGGNTPISFLQSKVADLTKTPGSAGKLLLAVSALGMDGKSFGGVNLIDVVNKSYDAKSGQYGKDVIGHAFAVLGLSTAGQPVPSEALAFLERTQGSEGGWAFSGDTSPGMADTNTTAVVIQAFVAQGKSSNASLKKAESYLVSQQNADSGFPFQKANADNSESDVNSTAYVVQALIAMGNTTAANKGLDFIVSLQKPSGAFQWKKSEADDNAGATYQAIPALLGLTLASFSGAVSTSPPTVEPPVEGQQPGMPTTGQGDTSPIAVIAAFGALILSVGVVARRRALATR